MKNQTGSLSLKFGEPHNLTVDKYVYESERVRYVCKNSSIIVNATSDNTITFDYTPQYSLVLESPYGVVNGSGWFDAEDTARFSISPDTVPMDGFLGLLGIKYVFQGWSGDIRTSSTSGHIDMISPRKGVAVWGADYSSIFAVLVGLIAVMIGIL